MGYLKNLKNEIYALEASPLPGDPTKPIYPFTPKPTGPTLPNREMAAYGGIMGPAGRRQYGIGSWFQEKIMDPIKENPEVAAAAALYGLDTFGGDQGILGGRLPGGKNYINDAIGTAVNFITGRDKNKEIEEEIGRVVKKNRSEGYKDGKFQLSDILDIGKDAVDFVRGTPKNRNTNRSQNNSGNKNYSEETYGNGQFEFSDILDFLRDKETIIPLGTIGTYIKEKFFPGEKEPDPYDKYLSNRKSDVENYLRLYGPKDFKRDVSKNPYSKEEIEQHVFDNTPEYRDKAASGGIMNVSRGNYGLGGSITQMIRPEPGSVGAKNLTADDILSVFKNKFGGKFNSGEIFAPEVSSERVNLDELSPEMLLGGMKKPVGLNEEEKGITSLLMQALRNLNFDRAEAAMGGRMGYNQGTPKMGMMASAPDPMDERNSVMENIAMQEFGKPLSDLSEDEIIQIEMMMEEMSMNKRKAPSIKMASMDDDYVEEFMKLVDEFMMDGFSQQEAIEAAKDEIERKRTKFMATGGRVNYAFGTDTPEENAMQAAGIEGLDININPKGITELDMRETGGFIPPVGIKEKEDDIPAMLSNNEFVFTADAVKGMGDGNVDKGAERMYSMMKKLEKGGRV